MDVKFADSFGKSLKRLIMHETWWYKTYEFFRRDIPYFLENVWYFRKELWQHRSWDYSYSLMILSRSLSKLAHTIEFYGNEVDGPRLKKVQKIKRAIEIIGHIRSDSYIEQAEERLGKLIYRDFDWTEVLENYEGLDFRETEEEKQHNRNVFNLSHKIEEDEIKELFDILRGQDVQEYRNLYDNLTEEEKNNPKSWDKSDLWDKWFDGSGIRGWWD